MMSDKWKKALHAVEKTSGSVGPRKRYGSQSSLDKNFSKTGWKFIHWSSVHCDQLKNRLQDLMAGQSDATKSLMRTSETLDRLRLDHKKKVEQIEKMQRDLGFKDDRIRNLEIRASEVEKAELILETTKQNLESCQPLEGSGTR
ncbi:hypothetical protein MAR_025696 [Mya arenaria]|uniref:Uncharacterized protein n=1 Tax=Mya arenaria TaxID=6604 RepID=A0ABY7EWF6_MYAAR|nr:hypothetical protein MAR_025696 [Mya arenaria]